MTIAERAPSTPPLAPTAPRAGLRSAGGTIAVAALLYGLAAALLLIRLGAHPPFPYNWEPYTARAVLAFWDRPSPAILASTGGLMTDSGYSPLVALPAWLAFRIGGVGLTALRAATALLAAGAVPLLWAVARRFVGGRAALLAALLLALSPVFLLYGRTATFVGLSLVPALATIAALRHVLRDPGARRWLVALQALLIVGSYCYAPIRFLWPLAVALLAWELALRPDRRTDWRRALAATVLVLPIAITIAAPSDRLLALPGYFEGRSEQVFGLSVAPEFYGAYLRLSPDEVAAGGPRGNRLTLAARLVAQNTADLAWLLLDRDTRPALTDYWTSRGRLYPLFLVPFFLYGLARAVRRARARPEDRLLLLHFLGFSLPMVLTSRVHIGRLIFLLPLLFLFVADGVCGLADRLAARAGRGRGEAWRWRPAFAGLIALPLLGAVAIATWRDYRESPPPPPEANVATQLRGDLPLVAARGGALLVLDGARRDDKSELDIERARVGAYRLMLDGAYRFVDLNAGEPPPARPGDERPTLYFGGLLDGLRAGAIPASLCGAVFYVEPSAAERLSGALAAYGPACGELVRPLPLP